MKRIAAVFTLLLSCSLLASHARSSVEITAVARTGDIAPVPGELVTASNPSLNDSGDVAFLGDDGIFLATSGQLQVVAGFGDPAPGGGTFTAVFAPSINARGQIVFVGAAAAPSRSGLFLFENGKITQLVVDGVDGVVATAAMRPSLNSTGQVAFVGATLTGSGVFLYSDGAITPVAQSGDPAPGGGTFRAGFQFPSVDAGGNVVFSASVAAPIVQGIFASSKGSLTKIAQTGDPAPGGGLFQSFDVSVLPVRSSSLSANDAGQVAFAASVGTAGAGIFLFSNGEITLLARQGDPAPQGGVLGFPSAPWLNNSGQVAFQAQFPDGNTGIFLYVEGKLVQITRPGPACHRPMTAQHQTSGGTVRVLWRCDRCNQSLWRTYAHETVRERRKQWH